MSDKFEDPLVTVDIVLLSLIEGELCACLLQRDKNPNAGAWTLPGGVVHTDEDEDLLASAERILKTKVGISSPYLEQLQTFGGHHRDPRKWSVSIAFYALLPSESVPTKQGLELRPAAADGNPGTMAMTGPAKLKWRPVDSIRTLPFDHLEILRAAVERVRSKTTYSSLPVHLMGKTFTLPQLQQVYEQVLGGTLGRSTFRRRIEELDIIEPVAAPAGVRGAHRPAQHYRLKRRYDRGIAVVDRQLGVKDE